MGQVPLPGLSLVGVVPVTVLHGSVDINSLAAQRLPEQGSEGGTSLCSLPPIARGVLEGVPALLMAQAPTAMGAGGEDWASPLMNWVGSQLCGVS